MASIKLSDTNTYSVRIRTKGFPTVCKTFHSLRDAKAWSKHIESDQQAGRWKAPDSNDGLTLGAALEKYCTEVTAQKKGASPEGYMIAAMRRAKLATKTLDSIRGSDIAALRDQWLQDGLAPATVRQRMAIISHCYSVAIQEWDFDGVNPVKRVRKPKINNGRDRRLLAGELDAVLSASTYRDLPTVALLAVETAMRLSEIIRLRWTSVNLSSKIVTLRDTKNGRARLVPLSPEALRLLSSIPRRIDGKVFESVGTAITKAWTRAVRKARAGYETDCEIKGVAADGTYVSAP